MLFCLIIQYHEYAHVKTNRPDMHISTVTYVFIYLKYYGEKDFLQMTFNKIVVNLFVFKNLNKMYLI